MHSIVNKQRDFFNQGKTRDLAYRKEQLRKFKYLIETNQEALYEAIFKDFNKSEFDTYTTELALLIDDIETSIKSLNKWAKPKRVRTNLANIPGKSMRVPEPYGVVLVIGAWNYPYLLSLQPAIAAMSAGNSVIVKPSELAVHTSALMAKLINETFDAGLLRVEEGGVPETTALLEQKFDKIFFTGSTAVGKIVYQAAAKNLTPVTLELGGKSPAIVSKNSPIDAVARRIVWGKFLNAGQTCIAPDYILVEREAKQELLDKLKFHILKFYEDPKESTAFMRIVNERNYKRLMDLIEADKVFYGGLHDANENYIEPTLLDNVTFSDKVMQEEIFGPILPVITYDSFDEAIDMVKQGEKPLALYLFTKNKQEEAKVLQELSFGGGAINDTIMHIANPNLPFGGVGASGIGNYHNEAGFKAFSHYKSVIKKGYLFDPWFKYPPYTESKFKWIKRFI